MACLCSCGFLERSEILLLCLKRRATLRTSTQGGLRVQFEGVNGSDRWVFMYCINGIALFRVSEVFGKG
jgi:hypothetical protein